MPLICHLLHCCSFPSQWIVFLSSTQAGWNTSSSLVRSVCTVDMTTKGRSSNCRRKTRVHLEHVKRFNEFVDNLEDVRASQHFSSNFRGRQTALADEDKLNFVRVQCWSFLSRGRRPHFQVPCQLGSVLKNRFVQHVFALNKDPAASQRFVFWLNHILQEG